MKIKEVAELARVSVRTLHHYDEIGLLKPDEITEAGYRIYTEANLDTLQQILFFKELGFPLKEIKEIMGKSDYDRQKALQMHKQMLLEKRHQIDKMLLTIDKTIAHTKGELTMTNKEKFEGFDFSNNSYEQEARERWGSEKVDEANAYIAGMTENQQQQFNDIFRKLAAIRDLSPSSKEAQELIKEWYDMLNTISKYSLDAFKGLGQMYVLDERFTNNIDQFGEGLAVFMSEAMAYYADDNKK